MEKLTYPAISVGPTVWTLHRTVGPANTVVRETVVREVRLVSLLCNSFNIMDFVESL